ncbi:MAG: DUF3082 domain-containing protein [Cyanobacteriota bacterium]|nr:DUF3082 domain-containing protein [Cyanobacteriota bacterium]
MSDLPASPDPQPNSDKPKVTLGRCLLGALISAALAIAMYSLTASIAQTFAAKPPTTSSELALRISIAVRTLVVGVTALGTGVFGFVSVGLVALGIQTAFFPSKESKPNAN